MMLLDRRDIELLYLVGRYRWLPCRGYGDFGLHGLEGAACQLTAVGLLAMSRKGDYLKLTPKSYDLLDRLALSYDPRDKRTYSGSNALRRRLETARMMLTCLRAGIDVAGDDESCLAAGTAFLAAFFMRNNGKNPLGSGNCGGFGHWGKTMYAFQYISPRNKGMMLANELQTLENMAKSYGDNAPTAMFFAGESYSSVYHQLSDEPPPPSKNKGKNKGKSKSKLVPFAEVYRRIHIPIHLLACNELGAVQLRVMCVHGYNSKIARAAFGERWSPPDGALIDTDGYVDGKPLVIAVDMDVRRVERVLYHAYRQGRPEVIVVAFPKQISEVLCHLVPQTGFVTLLAMEMPVLEAAFGKDFTLYTPGRAPAIDAEGGIIYA